MAGTQSIPITSPHVNYARYIVPVPVAEGSDGSVKRGQALERAWRDLNARGPVYTDGSDGVDNEVDQGAEGSDGSEPAVYAVIKVEEGSAPALWAFGMNGGDLPELDGLEVTDRGALDCRKLVTCPAHGNDLGCLSNSKSSNRGCDVKWTPGEMGRYWDTLSSAMMEGLAWRGGKRVYADRFECRLWPLTNDRLALVVQDRPPKESLPSQGLRLHTLEPIGIRAIPLGDYHPTADQRFDLISRLSSSLGPGAVDLRVMDLDADLNVGQAEWGVYWVSSKADLCDEDDIRRHPGRITVWPRSLVRSVPHGTITADDVSSTSTPPALPLPASADSSPDSLMQVATGLFDFFNTYVPPSEVDIADITPETEGPDHLDSSPFGDAASIGPSPTPPKSRRASDAASDLDDLFSAGSPSPPTATKMLDQPALADTLSAATSAVPSGKRDGSVDPVGLADLTDAAVPLPLDQSEPDMSMDIDEDMYAQMKEWEDLTGLADGSGRLVSGSRVPASQEDAPVVSVTEDDFNFFDSPPATDATMPSDTFGNVDNAAAPPILGDQALPVATDLTTMDANLSKGVQASGAPVVADGVLPDAEGTASAPIEIDEVVDGPVTESVVPAVEMPSVKSAENAVQDALDIDVTNVDPPARRKMVTFEIEQSPPPPDLEDAEVVPLGYEPLDIEPALTSFKYSLPSPAASPETEPPYRVELIKRMQDAAKKGKKDTYASEWDIESEQSEEEDSEDFSGAPPTPVSMVDTEPIDSLATSPRREALIKDGAEGMSWEGMDVLGPDEISELRWDAAEAGALSWKDAWNRFGAVSETAGVQDIEVERILEGVDVKSLFDTLLTNRHLRHLLLDVAARQRSVAGMEAGATLGDTPKSLVPCDIHVGLRDSVCQIAMSALLYTRQLGIQPLGGDKDVQALVLAESDDRRAKGFLSRMSLIYETYSFGSHRRAKHSLAKEGIISLPAVGFADTLSAMLPNLPIHTVVYVLLPVTEPSALAKLLSKLLAVRATPDNVVLKIVTAQAFDNDAMLDMAYEVYDKITRSLDPISVRGSHIDLSISSLQYPAFTLAPANDLKVDLSLSWPLRSYDVLNRWRLVHCAYGWNKARDRIVGFVIDSAGEGWSQHGQAVEGGKVDDALPGLFDFFVEFAKMASVEYRLSVCAVGGISRSEVDYWTKTGPTSKVPLTLVVSGSASHADPDRVRIPSTVVPISGAIFADSTTRLIDESLAGTTSDLPRLPLRLTDKSGDLHIIPMSSVGITIGQPDSATTLVYHILSHRCPPERPDQGNELISNEFYRLACLARLRFGVGRADGEADEPVHVAYVRTCVSALDLLKRA